MVNIAIQIEHPAWEEALPEVKPLVMRAAAAGLEVNREGLNESSELSIVLCDETQMRALNKDYRGKDKSTNVLSFPSTFLATPMPAGAPQLLGDVIVCFETVREEARTQGKALSDHLSHLIVHGVLHLLGFDHETQDEVEIMEAHEIAVLRGLDIANPYDQGEEIIPAHG